MVRAFAAFMFLCLVGAPTLAQAQSVDCTAPAGLLERICAAPELIALEEERRLLVSELESIDTAHPMLGSEDAWLAEQSACADTACLSNAYLAHNAALRSAVQGARASGPTAPTEAAPEEQPKQEARERDERAGPGITGPAVEFAHYVGAIVAVIVTFFIALWLLGAAARARREDREG